MADSYAQRFTQTVHLQEYFLTSKVDLESNFANSSRKKRYFIHLTFSLNFCSAVEEEINIVRSLRLNTLGRSLAVSTIKMFSNPEFESNLDCSRELHKIVYEEAVAAFYTPSKNILVESERKNNFETPYTPGSSFQHQQFTSATWATSFSNCQPENFLKELLETNFLAWITGQTKLDVENLYNVRRIHSTRSIWKKNLEILA